ncbi:DUF485 domain-containing protein [Leucobacter aridicollis]|uniref:Uncharacterized membrane protein (DUF485 family) n=1 Tax=Leucobacter aridicollis TaxID=283878 RepID=A0A852R3Y7_9MICO|nr:DUF485 domain-containing protein [Leucobacter aridicollis]MBL3681530.1 DUF485 domain-containing protein [Leucobacter aridicollis]NYD27437.1 uncharacterized membrane protein (DUF485 family) [Leucobacter aridicollis]
MSDENPTPVETEVSPIDYEEFQASPEFQDLKRTLRRFVFPLTAAFLAWFLAYVLLGAFAHDFMAQPLLGMNVGLWLGLLQFVTTFGITTAYVMFANRRIDPRTEALRAELEDRARGAEGAER